MDTLIFNIIPITSFLCYEDIKSLQKANRILLECIRSPRFWLNVAMECYHVNLTRLQSNKCYEDRYILICRMFEHVDDYKQYVEIDTEEYTYYYVTRIVEYKYNMKSVVPLGELPGIYKSIYNAIGILYGLIGYIDNRFKDSTYSFAGRYVTSIHKLMEHAPLVLTNYLNKYGLRELKTRKRTLSPQFCDVMNNIVETIINKEPRFIISILNKVITSTSQYMKQNNISNESSYDMNVILETQGFLDY